MQRQTTTTCPNCGERVKIPVKMNFFICPLCNARILLEMSGSEISPLSKEIKTRQRKRGTRIKIAIGALAFSILGFIVRPLIPFTTESGLLRFLPAAMVAMGLALFFYEIYEVLEIFFALRRLERKRSNHPLGAKK